MAEHQLEAALGSVIVDPSAHLVLELDFDSEELADLMPQNPLPVLGPMVVWTGTVFRGFAWLVLLIWLACPVAHMSIAVSVM